MGVNRYWQQLNPQTRVVVIFAIVFAVVRLALATQSTFPWHQGWNEGLYAMIAHGFLDHPLEPQYGDRHIYNVPPLFPYIVSLSFAIFGESTVAARAPSTLFGAGTILATYFLGHRVFRDQTVAAGGACLLGTLPYFLLYSGRAQTDVAMLWFFTSSLYAIVRGYEEESSRWLAAGGVLFALGVTTKQPTVLLAGVVLCWLVVDRRCHQLFGRETGVIIGVSALALLPLFAWLALNYLASPAAFVHDWQHELFTRTPPFANVKLLATVGLSLGVTPPVLALAAVGSRPESGRWLRETGSEAVLLLWVLLYGSFVLYRTPHGHQYYLVGLLVPLSLYAARGVARAGRFLRARKLVTHRPNALVAGLLVVLTLSASGVLVGLAGDYAVGGGETVSGEAGEFVAGSIPDKATVYVVNEYGPPIQWYAREGFNASKVNVYYVSKFTPEFASKLQNDFDVPVYLMYPTTSTDRAPDLPYERVYETSVYRPPFVSSLGVLVDAPGKFQYYLDGRGLVVYRLDAANESVAAAGERAGVSEALGDAPQHRSRLTAHAE
jgi:hypothetical protein